MDGHYVVIIDVKKVDPPGLKDRINPQSGRNEKVQVERETTDVTHVVMKADDLDAAIKKAVSVLNLEISSQ